MYRGRVDAVDGWRVMVGGKWLRCIGNKAVKVGDRVWTDGRCVYGNEQDSQSPIVIANPEIKEDLGIPIIQGEKFYTYHKELAKEEGRLSYSCRFTNNKKGEVCYSRDSNVVAINVDKGGNVYKIVNDDGIIKILKNDLVIKTVSNYGKEEAYNEAEELFYGMYDTSLLVPLGGVMTTYIYYDIHISVTGTTYKTRTTHSYLQSSPYVVRKSNILWAFIKDEDNWGIVANSSCEVYVDTPKNRSGPTGTRAALGSAYAVPEVRIDAGFAYRVSGISQYVYLIDDKGKHLMLHSSKGSLVNAGRGVDWNAFIVTSDFQKHVISAIGLPPMDLDYVNIERYTPFVYEYENILGTKFCMQDDFYFVVDSLVTRELDIVEYALMHDYDTVPPFFEVTIYGRSGKKVFNGTFDGFPYICVAKTGDGKYLMGVSKPGLTFHREDKINVGLYEIAKGEIKKYYDNGIFLNQCLRPMKRYKDWTDRIKIIT